MIHKMTNSQLDGQVNRVVNAPANSSAGSPIRDWRGDVEPSNETCAHALFDVVPQVMQSLRAEMRRQRGSDLSVLQLRALAFLHNNPGATLSLLAEHVGLTLPSMSSQVSGLVARNLIDRSISAEDRRFVTLNLTEQGQSVLQTARQNAQDSLAKTLSALSPDERATVIEAMQLLARVFAPPSSDHLPEQSPSQSSIT